MLVAGNANQQTCCGVQKTLWNSTSPHEDVNVLRDARSPHSALLDRINQLENIVRIHKRAEDGIHSAEFVGSPCPLTYSIFFFGTECHVEELVHVEGTCANHKSSLLNQIHDKISVSRCSN